MLGTVTAWVFAATIAVAPGESIQAAIDVAMPGDTVVVAAGTYAESLRTVRDGDAGAPIAVRAAGDGDVVVTVSGRVLDVRHAYFTVDGVIFDGQYGARAAVAVDAAGHDFTLRNSEVRRSGRDCVDLGGAANVTIERSAIHHCLDATGGRTDAHGVTGGAVRNLTIRDSDIHTFSGDAIQFAPARPDPGWDGIVIEGCRLWLEPLPQPENGFAAGVVPGENAVDSKTPAGGPRASLIIRDTTAFGFRGGMISNMAAFNLKENIDAVVDGVTVYDSEIALRLRFPARVRVQNALIYDSDTAVRYEDGIEELRLWNVTIGAGVGRALRAASSAGSAVDVRNTAVVAASLPDEAAGVASNLAVPAGAFDAAYRPVAGSPVIDTGEPIAEVTADRAGTPRPQGAGYDVGAFEFCGAACGSPDAGAGADAGGADAGGAGSADGDAAGGCGCRAGGRRSPAWAASVLVAAALARVRRRGRRRGP